MRADGSGLADGAGAGPAAVPPVPEPSRETRALHSAARVWDAHCDTLQRVLIDGADLGERTDGQTDLPRWAEGGVDVQVFAVWVDAIYGAHHAARRALQQVDALYSVLEAYPGRIALARTVADVRRINAQGKLAAVLAIEGGIAIQEDLSLLRTFHRLGATSLTLTHTNTLSWVDSSTDEVRSGGLGPFGRDVVRELNRLRMLVDVSHVSDAAVRDALEVSTAPVIASHSSCRALCDSPRNLPDALIRAIAESGGVVGINFFSGFLDEGYRQELDRRDDLFGAMRPAGDVAPAELDTLAAERRTHLLKLDLPRPPFERIIEHIEHAVEVAGVDHVGLGADLDAVRLPTPAGLDGVDDYPRITEALLRRGWSEDDVRKVLGGNWLRVFEEVVG